MALTIATGFVVDDAIVVIENITRHLENGMKPMQAALQGAQEIGFTVLSMSVSLIAVFIPILMMSGIVGRLFREFAVVLSVAIAISMVVSVTVTPMMCAWLLPERRSHGYLYNQTEKFFKWIISTYASALHVVLDHPASVTYTPAAPVASRYGKRSGSEGIFSAAGYGTLAGITSWAQRSISYQSLVDKAKWFEELIRVGRCEVITMVAGSSKGYSRRGGTQPGVGTLMAMVLFKSNLDLIGMIGILLLIGIVKKNAIMMIDFALAAERNQGMSPRDAIYQACLLRFRPIMMTTMCALLGGLPMALGWGAGGELRRPLGIAIVGGLLVSQMLTLFTTPVIYLYLDRLRNVFARRQPDYGRRPGFLIPGGVAGSGD